MLANEVLWIALLYPAVVRRREGNRPVIKVGGRWRRVHVTTRGRGRGVAAVLAMVLKGRVVHGGCTSVRCVGGVGVDVMSVVSGGAGAHAASVGGGIELGLVVLVVHADGGVSLLVNGGGGEGRLVWVDAICARAARRLVTRQDAVEVVVSVCGHGDQGRGGPEEANHQKYRQLLLDLVDFGRRGSTYVLKTPRPTMALLGPQALPQSLAVL